MCLPALFLLTHPPRVPAQTRLPVSVQAALLLFGPPVCFKAAIMTPFFSYPLAPRFWWLPLLLSSLAPAGRTLLPAATCPPALEWLPRMPTPAPS